MNPVGISLRSHANRLVFASNFRLEDENPRSGKDTCLTVVDPDANEQPLEVKVTADEICLHSYCKILGFCGMAADARRLLQGQSLDLNINSSGQVINVGEEKVFPLLRTESQIIGLDANVAQLLFKNEPGLATSINDTLLRNRESGGLVSTEDKVVLPNGLVYLFI